MAEEKRLDDTDFEIHRGAIILVAIVVLIAYGFGPGSLAYFAISDLTDDDPTTNPDILLLTAIFLAWLLGLALILLYAVFSAYRFRFTEEGMDVFTWRGRQFFRWNDATGGRIAMNKGSASLVLSFGGLRRVSVPLSAFRKSRTLLTEISRRVPVQVRAAESQLAMIQDHQKGT